MENTEGIPKTFHYSKQIDLKDTKITLHMFGVEFNNAIFVSVYDNEPKMGSFSQGYTIQGVGQTSVIFQGKHNQYADALTSLFAKKSGKLCYGSINISHDEGFSIGLLKELIDQYSTS